MTDDIRRSSVLLQRRAKVLYNLFTTLAAVPRITSIMRVRCEWKTIPGSCGKISGTRLPPSVCATSRVKSPDCPRIFSQLLVAFWVLGLLCAGAANGQPQAIDSQKSTLTVRVDKAGVLSGFGHNHEIGAPIARGTVDPAGRQVELYVKAGALQVRDPEASAKDRAEIQKTMLGPEVLDATRYPEIVFRSTGANAAGPNSWIVEGTLTLHGQARPVTVEVKGADGHYTGTARLKQTDFGMTPVKVAGGTIRVKDQVRIDFDIQVRR